MIDRLFQHLLLLFVLVVSILVMTGLYSPPAKLHLEWVCLSMLAITAYIETHRAKK